VKVLVDSCVWSLSLRRRTGAEDLKPQERLLLALLTDSIQDGRAVLLGPVRQEVLSGVRNAEQFEKLDQSLALFPDQPIQPDDYVQAARLDCLCRRRGVQCGAVDMLLCAVAMRNEWTILTNDAGLLRCIEVIERELISEEERMRGRKLSEVDW